MAKSVCISVFIPFRFAFWLVLAVFFSGCQSGKNRPEPFSPTPTSNFAITATTAAKHTSGPTAVIIERRDTPTPIPSRTPAPDPYLPEDKTRCLEKEGRFELGQLPTPLLRDPLDYRVYLPPCYGENPEQRYPVLYLIHGQSYTDDQWERLGAGTKASALISTEEIPPLLIVMPRDRLWSQPTEDNFGKAVVEVLIPWIDEQYATVPERAYRAIGGLSRGAGWAVHLGLSEWELFGAIGGHSLPVFWTDTYHIRSWLKEIPEKQMPYIYLDIGDKDRPEIMASAIWFEELLTQNNIAHVWFLYPGYHEEQYWEKNMERYLRWYTQPWKSD